MSAQSVGYFHEDHAQIYIEKDHRNLAFPMRLTLLSTRLTPNQRRFELAAEMPVFLRRFSVTGCSGLRAVQSRSCGRTIARADAAAGYFGS